ncbi:hypothetical protein DPX16_0130 [Anabarilius grahami]|uniref:Uncharacterized protein n=1 Tax=Anabarilius grahami TaxID=495550 RepID=A0A3N0YP55_ANAGA|nr:hypothetical protein DPX16_0130 [Anabarilius grahami]
MYGTRDVTILTVCERKKIRDDELDANPDVLFKIYSPVYPAEKDKLCALVFRSTQDPIRWMTLLNDTYSNITTQWTPRKFKPLPRNVIKISRSGDEIQTICKEFPNHLATINHPGDVMEDLEARAQRLTIQPEQE